MPLAPKKVAAKLDLNFHPRYPSSYTTMCQNIWLDTTIDQIFESLLNALQT